MNQRMGKTTNEPDLRAALLALLDAVDYTKGACSPTEMVGAVLPQVLIGNARKALSSTA